MCDKKNVTEFMDEGSMRWDILFTSLRNIGSPSASGFQFNFKKAAVIVIASGEAFV